ncbi:TerD family protein [Streptomyces sp. NPDC001744]|uniref:TerD family protein n=1 Tax=Streptomyces sp. NPDC001744 TaxID=3364606 RepID=UPI0036758A0A
MNRIPERGDVPLPPGALHVAVGWRTGRGVPDVDVSALLLGAGERVRGDADLVFYNHARHPSGAVRHLGRSAPGAPGSQAADWLWLDLARVEPEIRRLVIAASADGGALGRVPGLDVRVTDAAGAPLVYRPLGGATTGTALVVGEFRRDGGGWGFRAADRGYASGLAGLATDFGIVAEPPPPPVPGPGYVPPPAPPPPRAAPPARTSDPYGGEFRPAAYRGRGRETVRCGPDLPAGRWVLVEIESYHSLSTTVEACDAYGRPTGYLLAAYEDDVRARTVALVPRARPLSLRVEADAPWTLRVLPLSRARRFDSHVEGLAHDLVRYDGPAAVLDFLHRGASRFTVHRHAPPPDPLHDDEERELLVDAAGGTGGVRVSVPVPGPGLLRIGGDGPWKCAVRP